MGVKVRQRQADGPWWVFIAHKGKRCSKCVGDYDKARTLAKELRHALAADDLGLFEEPEPEPAGVTFGEYAARFLKAAETTLKLSAWKEYDRYMRKELLPVLGTRPLANITRRDVKSVLQGVRAKGKTENVVRYVRVVLSSMLSEAVDDELIETNPALQLRRRGHKQQTVPRAAAGLRFGEAAALQIKDIDWQHCTITVERAFVRGRIGLPKHDKVRRVHVPEGLLDMLAEMIAERFDKVRELDAEATPNGRLHQRTSSSTRGCFPT